MTPDRFQQLEKLFESALERQPSQRPAFLDQACGDDPSLRRQLEALLASHEEAPSFLESPSLKVIALLTEDEGRFMVGQQIGPYEVLREIGRGGMGEVYLAQDKRLGRQVALKFLPTSFQEDSDRRARLLTEARAASSLHSPHIAAIHDIGEHESRAFIVMEYVEGEPLSEKLKGGPMAPSEAIDIAMQIAEALEEAHERGIIHRDIKSSNLIVTPRGQVKVLDFGLAKVAQRVGAGIANEDSALTAQQETAPGMVMGTVHYMSPEQARGLAVDVRTDLFSLGVVIYEMMAGRLPFEGETSSDVLAAILEHDPEPLAHHRREVPAELQRVVHKSLEKDRQRRYQSATDLLIDLKNLKRDSDSVAIPTVRRPRLAVSTAVGLTLVAAMVAAAWLWLRSQNPTPPSRSDYVQLTNFPDSVTQPALSPDGRILTFVRGPDTFAGLGQIYVKMLPEGEPVQLTSDNLQKMSPVFSPDGSKIAYTTVAGVHWDTWVVPVLSGQPQLWLPNASGLVWLEKGKILFSEIKDNNIHMALVAAEASRNGERDIYLPAGSLGMAHRSYPSPDGKWALVVEHGPGIVWLPCRLVPMDGSTAGLQVGPPSAGCTFAAWSPDGKWMYLNSSAGGAFHIWRQRFSDGRPEQITSGPTEEEGIAMAPDGRSFITAVGLRQSSIWIHDSTGERQVSLEGYSYDPKFTPDGKKLCYRILNGVLPLSGPSELRVVELDSGRREVLLPGFSVIGPRGMAYDISPDSQQVIVAALDHEGKRRLWLAPLDEHSPPRQIPNVEGQRPLFGPDGEIFFRIIKEASSFVYRVRDNGSGLQRVSQQPDTQPIGISRDGQWLLAGGQGFSVTAFPLRGGSPVPILRANVASSNPNLRWSPDGKLVVLSLPTAALLTGGRTYAIPLPPGRALPEVPAGGFQSEAEIAKLPGVRRIDAYEVAFGPKPEVYAFARETAQRNLYRIPLP